MKQRGINIILFLKIQIRSPVVKVRRRGKYCIIQLAAGCAAVRTVKSLQVIKGRFATAGDNSPTKRTVSYIHLRPFHNNKCYGGIILIQICTVHVPSKRKNVFKFFVLLSGDRSGERRRTDGNRDKSRSTTGTLHCTSYLEGNACYINAHIWKITNQKKQPEMKKLPNVRLTCRMQLQTKCKFM